MSVISLKISEEIREVFPEIVVEALYMVLRLGRTTAAFYPQFPVSESSSLLELRLTGTHFGFRFGGASYREYGVGVSGQAVQPVPLASLKLSMAVYVQKLDGRPSR